VHLKLNKVVVSLLLITATLFAKNANYAVSDIHTLTIPKGSFNFTASYMLINDTIDLLNIKQAEFGANANFNSLGDMNGFELGGAYGLQDDLMMSYKFAQQNIGFNNNEFENTKNEIFLRYNILQNSSTIFNSGVSLDIGFINNTLKNIYISDINDINKLSKRYSNENFQIVPDNGGLSVVNNNQSTQLSYYPWVGLKDTSDNSFYLRAIAGINTDNGLYDFYVGIKHTKIKNTITANQELLSLAATNNYDIYKDLQRDENMFFLGTSILQEISDFVLEFAYEFDYFKRDAGLDYINFNHIIDLSLDYKLSKNLLLFAGGKILYRQLNGQIPYLYNQYTQTTYDHMYGYAKFGLTYKFKLK